MVILDKPLAQVVNGLVKVNQVAPQYLMVIKSDKRVQHLTLVMQASTSQVIDVMSVRLVATVQVETIVTLVFPGHTILQQVQATSKSPNQDINGSLLACLQSPVTVKDTTGLNLMVNATSAHKVTPARTLLLPVTLPAARVSLQNKMVWKTACPAPLVIIVPHPVAFTKLKWLAALATTV
jgi:hypothetical protein